MNTSPSGRIQVGRLMRLRNHATRVRFHDGSEIGTGQDSAPSGPSNPRTFGPGPSDLGPAGPGPWDPSAPGTLGPTPIVRSSAAIVLAPTRACSSSVV